MTFRIPLQSFGTLVVSLTLVFMAGLLAPPAGAAQRAVPATGGTALLHMAAAQGKPAPLLSPEQLAKIEKLIHAHKRKAVIDPKVANLLGLGKNGKPVIAGQVALVDRDKKTRHIFDRLQDGSGFLIGKRTADTLAVYRVDNAFTTYSSVLWRADGNKASLRKMDTAKLLREELQLWGQFADRQK